MLQPPVLASQEAHPPSVPQGLYSQLRILLLVTLSQEPKRGVEIARPRRQRPLKPAWDPETGAKERGGQENKKETNEKASNYPQGGRRAPEYLCNFVRKTSNNLWYT